MSVRLEIEVRFRDEDDPAMAQWAKAFIEQELRRLNDYPGVSDIVVTVVR